MKKNAILAVAAIIVFSSAIPSYAFLDYLFSGASNKNAIDNSALGDLRAWWSGNPAYTFNPYYSGPTRPQPGQPGAAGQPGTPGSGMPPQAMQPQVPQPTIQFTPRQQGAANPYAGQAYQQPAQQMPYGYGQQAYQQPMQQAPYGYGQQAYQQPMQQAAPGYPAPAQGGYQYPQNYQGQYQQ